MLFFSCHFSNSYTHCSDPIKSEIPISHELILTSLKLNGIVTIQQFSTFSGFLIWKIQKN